MNNVGTGFDEMEEEILRVLSQGKALGFNEIAERVSREMSTSSPKVSRRLKRLVDLGIVKRTVIDDWPPRSLYSISNIKIGTSPKHPSMTTSPLPENMKKRPRYLFTPNRIAYIAMAMGLVIGAAALDEAVGTAWKLSHYQDASIYAAMYAERCLRIHPVPHHG